MLSSSHSMGGRWAGNIPPSTFSVQHVLAGPVCRYSGVSLFVWMWVCGCTWDDADGGHEGEEVVGQVQHGHETHELAARVLHRHIVC